ncbi:PAS domain-containing sensor histidine kinase [Rhodovulum sulfidophilum]|uniref:histidine kinase n=1 Tax=Rhodovulum sulfidophilum TaxID=35806 RepID=A0ABS1RVR9_RHOSU|nr:PAS domain-containing sensor histidine kinase [Rhodovulum sulfidophilum]MBL3596477.1 PAS domain-containing sensor histidine kinase [Rhodovulum sulfidophilum]MBL3609758.1 PAS domain-containing sensor histidine kinase [Rhodovulum sulfidophilum]MCE8458623.1 PAS domain-containing sensor histidine kinase [Rhodovulum sulfidophilum]
MARDITRGLVSGEGEFSDAVWADVLSAVDRTYVDLVDYQEQLEAKNAELETMRSFLGSILASVSDVLIVVARGGRVEEVSASTALRTGAPREGFAGRPVTELFSEADRPALEAAMTRAGQGRCPVMLEAGLIAAEGETPLELSLSPRMDERGRVTGHVLTGRPLGELRQAYAELAASHDELKAAQALLVRNEKLASLGRLLAGVAHELNNPISFVYANAHALERYAGKFETYFERVQSGADRAELVRLREELRLDREIRNLRDAVAGARDGAERVRDIVEDLRRLSSEGSGERVAFDLVETARVAASWVMRGSRGDVEIGFAGADRVMALGRPGHVQQVVMNLVQNARDAAGPGGRMELWFGAEAEAAVLKVSDDGPGVPDAVRTLIFDPFFTTKEVGQGTGLGLAISAKIAAEHGGQLSLCPAGTGACFRLDLPLAGDRP